MHRIFCIMFTWSVLAIGFALANPVRPPYVPEPIAKPPAPKVTFDMAGSKWLGKYNVANRYYTFEIDGTVSYSPSPTTKGIKNRGSWRIEGNTFNFDHNIGAAKMLEFRGTFTDANTLVGEQTMTKTGVKSNVTMQRQLP